MLSQYNGECGFPHISSAFLCMYPHTRPRDAFFPQEYRQSLFHMNVYFSLHFSQFLYNVCFLTLKNLKVHFKRLSWWNVEDRVFSQPPLAMQQYPVHTFYFSVHVLQTAMHYNSLKDFSSSSASDTLFINEMISAICVCTCGFVHIYSSI